MAAGIQELDRGIVRGETWHKLPQYKTLGVGEEIDAVDAESILDYKVEKMETFLAN